MTLILGLWTKNGVIIAADSAATFGVQGIRTISHDTKKVFNIADNLVFGASGPAGLAGIYVDALTRAYADKKFASKPSPTVVAQEIQTVVRPAWETALRQSNQAATAFQDGSLLDNARMTSLIAFAHNRTVHLVEFMADNNFELHGSNLPFVTIGSGQLTADPFTKFAVRVVAGESSLTTESATTAAVWVLKHAIECSPGGVGGPIQIMRLESDGSQVSVAELSESQIEVHRERITEVEGRITGMLGELDADALENLDAAPPPSPDDQGGKSPRDAVRTPPAVS